MKVLEQTLAAIDSDPLRFLSERSPLALEAFMSGYSAADSAASVLSARVASAMPGPSEACAFTKAYLLFPDDWEGLAFVLGALREEARRDSSPPHHGEFAGRYLTMVFDALKEGRPALVVSEPRPARIADCLSGYFQGLSVLPPEVGAIERGKWDGFLAWFLPRFQLSAPWHKVATIFLGAGPGGLAGLSRLWEEFSTLKR